ncbi:MAG TPA: hypothetical protein VF236_01795, partial [Gaiellaceae bacterium]
SRAFRIAVVAACVQAALHLGNALVLDRRVANFDADVEGNMLAWAGSAAIFAAACASGLLALLRPAARWAFGLLAAALAFLSLDETAAIHERIGQAGVRVLDLSDDDYGRAIWPIVLFPMLAGILLGLWRLASAAPPDVGRTLRIGAGLLVAAVGAEFLWTAFPVSGGEVGSWPDALQVSLEEALELAGWVLVAAGLAWLALSETLALAARASGRPT